jgi:hypothetical protein
MMCRDCQLLLLFLLLLWLSVTGCASKQELVLHEMCQAMRLTATKGGVHPLVQCQYVTCFCCMLLFSRPHDYL